MTSPIPESSEDTSRSFQVQAKQRTPPLTHKKIEDMLIEDRLEQLETILPDYTRRRIYETSTITITKVVSNKRSMATLLVQNCVPQGYEVCPRKIISVKKKKRKSKVARESSNPLERLFYFG